MSSEIVAKLFRPLLWQHMRADFLPFEVIPVDHFRLLNKSLFSQRRFLAVLLLFASGVAAASRIGTQSAATATAQEKSASYAAAREHARALAKEWLARGIPGFNVAVAIDGKIIYSEGFGYADLEQRVPAWQITKFRIGSVSKPLTSAALMKLVEQGKIDLDAPIQKYVPTFPDKGALITPRMLAGHLGGIRHYKENEVDNQKHYDSVVAGLERFQNDPLVVPPGTKFSYSSYGYNLLSAAMEAAAGKPFLEFEQEQVFTPLGLLNTSADQPADIIPQRARFYSGAKGVPTRNSMFVDNSYKWAGGGFISTSEDLVRFGSVLFQPGYLKAESLAMLFTPQKTKDGKETNYGMGWFIGKSKSGKRIFEHSGGSVGGTSDLILYPDTHMVVAFVCNYDGESWKGEEVQALAEAFEK